MDQLRGLIMSGLVWINNARKVSCFGLAVVVCVCVCVSGEEWGMGWVRVSA